VLGRLVAALPAKKPLSSTRFASTSSSPLQFVDAPTQTHPAIGYPLLRYRKPRHPTVECARDGEEFAGWELTGAAGLSEDESHGQAPHPQHRVQTADRPGLHCRRDAPYSRQPTRHRVTSSGFESGSSELERSMMTPRRLSKVTPRKLLTLAKDLEANGVAAEPGPRLRPGAQLIREWRGRRCDAGRLRYAHQSYPSLTKIAMRSPGHCSVTMLAFNGRLIPGSTKKQAGYLFDK
jgi:hypothetical protein